MSLNEVLKILKKFLKSTSFRLTLTIETHTHTQSFIKKIIQKGLKTAKILIVNSLLF
jgi:hypothetical protein